MSNVKESELQLKIQQLKDLKNQKIQIKDIKKKLNTNFKPLRSDIEESIKTNHKSSFALGKSLYIYRIPIKDSRKPGMLLVYKAIENILGKDSLLEVKEEIKHLKFKKRNDSDPKVHITIFSSNRKIRNDKGKKHNYTKPKKQSITSIRDSSHKKHRYKQYMHLKTRSKKT